MAAASQVFSLDAGQSEATSTLSFPASSGPSGESGVLWARASRTDGISGPPAVAPTLPPLVDRFAGQEITGVGTWNYAILSGQTVVTNGTLTRSGESLTGIDFSGLSPSVQYTLVITPVAIGGQFPLPEIGTSVDIKSDYQFWQNLHFSSVEQSPDLVNWNPASIGEQDIENIGAASEAVTLRPELLKPSDTPAMFYRLAFTLNTP